MKNDQIDLSSMKKEQFLLGIGDLFMSMLGANQIALAAMNKKGEVTFLNPVLVKQIDPQALAEALLESWDDDQVEAILEFIHG